jgi:predicted PurR-regulated permease PerM
MSDTSEEIKHRLQINSRAMLLMLAVFLTILLAMVGYIIVNVRHNVEQAAKRGHENAIVLQFLKDVQDPNSDISQANNKKTEALVDELITQIKQNRIISQEILNRLGG